MKPAGLIALLLATISAVPIVLVAKGDTQAQQQSQEHHQEQHSEQHASQEGKHASHPVIQQQIQSTPVIERYHHNTEVQQSKGSHPTTSSVSNQSTTVHTRDHNAGDHHVGKQSTTGKQQSDFKAAFRHNAAEQTKISRQAETAFKKNHPDHRNWFKKHFFENHNFRPRYYDHGHNYWRRSHWRQISNWLNCGWAAPVYYDTGGYLFDVPEEQDSYLQEESEQDSVDEWLPLGVFAIGKTPEAASTSALVLQLAVDRQGNIAGTYYNDVTNEARPLEGAVDTKTQLASIQLADSENPPLMTTGMYNLTQDVAPVQVDFPNETSETWFFVRLNE